jgi:hypothetical protein
MREQVGHSRSHLSRRLHATAPGCSPGAAPEMAVSTPLAEQPPSGVLAWCGGMTAASHAAQVGRHVTTAT